jgi:hypothetical protein
MLEMSGEIENSSFLETSQHTFAISDSISLKVYSSNDPQNLKIADLQKGLILLCDGTDVIGEGIGFGVPIAKYYGETVFSGSSTLKVRKQENVIEIQKEFLMDLMARDRFRNLKLENPKIRTLFDHISELSQRHKRLARSISIVKGLFFKFGVKSSFIRSPIRGSVIVTYILNRNRILVKLNFSQLERKNLGKVFVLNEQSAHFFSIYSDSEGLRLVDEEIGIWDNVIAQSARIINAHNKIGFCLKHIEGSVLRRGREVMAGSLDWIGLDYELDAEQNHFEYEIELLGDQPI